MNKAEMIVELIKSGAFQEPEVRPQSEESGNTFYELIWQKNDGLIDTIVACTIRFKFDMHSFLQIYHNLYPEFRCTEKLVLGGIALGFNHVAYRLFATGKDNYIELAKILHPILQTQRGRITGKDYGV